MKTRKNLLIIFIVMLITLVCFFNTNYVQATITDPIENPSYYEPTDTTGTNTEFIRMGNIVITIMQILGTVIAVITLMVIGCRYIFGSLEERANYKETMVPYLIGAVMIFVIPTILRIIYDLVKGITV